MRALELFKFELVRLITIKNTIISLFLSVSSLLLSPLNAQIYSLTVAPNLSMIRIDYVNELISLRLSYLDTLLQPINALYLFIPIVLLTVFLYDSLNDSVTRNEVVNRLILSVPLHTYFISKILASISLSFIYSIVIFLGILGITENLYVEISIISFGLLIYLLIYAFSITIFAIVFRNVWGSVISHLFLSIYTVLTISNDIQLGSLTTPSIILLVSYGSIVLYIAILSRYILESFFQNYADRLTKEVLYHFETIYEKYNIWNSDFILISLLITVGLGICLFYICRGFELYEYV